MENIETNINKTNGTNRNVKFVVSYWL